jgi:hypothetical protein
MRADVQRFSLKDPNDVSGLKEAIEKGNIDPFSDCGNHGDGGAPGVS